MYIIKTTTANGTTTNRAETDFGAWGQAYWEVCFNPLAEQVEVINEETGKVILGYKKKEQTNPEEDNIEKYVDKTDILEN